jgi:hypothetical protein
MDRTSPDSVVLSFSEAASVLGFAFVPHFSASLPDGTAVPALGLVRDFGSSSGTLLFCVGSEPSSDQLRAVRDVGYFYSLLNAESYDRYAERHFVDTLNDWGYFGARSDTPQWYTGRHGVKVVHTNSVRVVG